MVAADMEVVQDSEVEVASVMVASVSDVKCYTEDFNMRIMQAI